MSSRGDSPGWLDEPDALILHDRLLAPHGGAAGGRDEGLPTPAMARPRQHGSCGEAPDIVQLVTLCAGAIVRNPPFIDGNKCAGFVPGVLLLELNGFAVTASQEGVVNAMIALSHPG